MSTRNRARKSRQCAPSEGTRATYAAVVRAYELQHQENAARELRFFAIQKSLCDAIELAATARLPSGGKHSHQWRIPNSVLMRISSRLLAIEDQINRIRRFYELWNLVRLEGRQIRGIGELAVYDTAHRIGAYLG